MEKLKERFESTYEDLLKSLYAKEINGEQYKEGVHNAKKEC